MTVISLGFWRYLLLRPADHRGFMNRYVVIALGAGIVSALLYVSVTTGTSLSAVLRMAAPLPLFIAGLSFGAMNVLIAGLAGFFVTLLAGNPSGALEYMLTSAMPAVWLVRLALLARPANEKAREPTADPALEWYPPGRLAAWTATIVAALLISLGLMNWAEGGLRAVFAETLKPALESAALGALIADRGFAPEAFKQGMISVAPALSGIALIGLTLANMYVGQLVARRSGLARRPSPVIQEMELPPLLFGAFSLALVLSFLPGQFGFLAATAAALFAFPYFLLGLTVLHAISRPWPGRVWILALGYFLAFQLGFPLLILWGVGLLEPWLGLRKRFS
jgi:hypothetical protein